MTINSKGELIVSHHSKKTVKLKRKPPAEVVMLGYVLFVALMLGVLKWMG